MKRMRIGLIAAAAAVVAAMAFGTASASATYELCKVTSTTTCPAGKAYPEGSQFKAIGHAEFAGKACELEMAFTTTAASGAKVPAEITAFPFSNCPTGVTITAHDPPPHWEFLISGGVLPNGSGEIFQSGGFGPVEIEVVGLVPAACFYKLPTFTPSIIGGGLIFTSMTASLSTGSGCPVSPAFNFKIEPTPKLYITN